MFTDKELKRAKIDIQAELNRLEAQQTAKEVAGKSIGRYGLFYITLIVIIGVAASLQLEEGKMAAVMGLLGASLTALISMMNGIAGATPKQDKPEFDIMKQLIERLDRMADRDPMTVDVDGEKVTVRKGDNEVKTARKA
jgi:ABC-type proline/glycine betaine transport system ATPase subunit